MVTELPLIFIRANQVKSPLRQTQTILEQDGPDHLDCDAMMQCALLIFTRPNQDKKAADGAAVVRLVAASADGGGDGGAAGAGATKAAKVR